MNIKAYSYLRFSTPEQMKGDSHRRQFQMAVDYAARHGLDLQDVSFEDLGVSAYRSANAETGRLGEFMSAVQSGVIAQGSWLLLESMDRLSRAKPRAAVRLLESICDAGITLVTLADGKVYDRTALDDDPMAFMYAFMIAIRANEESATKARRLRAAWKQKRTTATERILTKRVPSWLCVVGDGKDRSFKVNEDQAAIVRRVFAMAAEGVGQHKIAETLNAEGVPTVGGAKHWHKSLIAKWLKSPAAIGTFIPHTIDATSKTKVRHPEPPVEGYYPPIISRELYEAVSALQGGDGKSRALLDGPKTLSSLLAGMARCCVCGGTMTRVNKSSKAKGGKTYLVCAAAKVGVGCEYRGVDQEVIERAVIGLAGQMREKVSSTILVTDDLAAQIRDAETRLADIELRFGNVQGELERQPAPVVRAMLDNLAGAKRAAEESLIMLRRRKAAGGAALVVRNAEAAAAALEADPLDIKKANVALRQAFDRAVIDWHSGYVQMHWRHSDEWVLRAPIARTTKLRGRRSKGSEQPSPPQSSNHKETK